MNKRRTDTGNRASKGLDDPLDPLVPEDITEESCMRLWKAVILRAFFDALWWDQGRKVETAKDKRRFIHRKDHRENAINFLTGRSPDMRTVCHLANVDAQHVIKRFNDLLSDTDRVFWMPKTRNPRLVRPRE